jgi:DNA N-6-adenine-methyltransferase (Dam)
MGFRSRPAEKMRRYRARLKRKRPPPKNVEWYTPKRYIEAARKVLGRIDCDPASSDIAQTVVRAKVYYTFQDDGLLQQWHGNVFLNPPYSLKGFVKRFVDKLLTEIALGNCETGNSTGAFTEQWDGLVPTSSRDKQMFLFAY